MKLSEVKKILPNLENVVFQVENGNWVPEHFHVTELGVISKHFIDCGGTERIEKVINFQLWDANDYDHRLKPSNLLNIINLSEVKLGMGDLEIEVEYQGKTIEKYGLDFNGTNFILVSKHTACLALDQCGLPDLNIKSMIEKVVCTPGSGCC